MLPPPPPRTTASRCVFFGGAASTTTTSTPSTWLLSFAGGGSGSTLLPVWTELILSSSGQHPRHRISPLLIGLSPTQFLIFGGFEPPVVASEASSSASTPPPACATDAYLGVISDDGTHISYFQISTADADAGAAFSYLTPLDAPTASTSTGMLTDKKDLVIVTPTPIGNFHITGTPFATADGAVGSGSGSMILVVTRIFLDRLVDNIVRASYGYVTASSGDDAWPNTPQTSVRMVPLAPGYALGMIVPRNEKSAPFVSSNTWVLSFRTAKQGWVPDLPTAAAATATSVISRSNGGAVIKWVNFGPLPGSPSLRSGMLLFSTASRLNPASTTAVVVAHGGRVFWRPPVPPALPSSVHVAVFTSSSTSFSIKWEIPAQSPLSDSDDLGKIGDVFPAEVIFPSTSTTATSPTTITTAYYGGYSRETEPRTTILSEVSIDLSSTS